MFAGARIKSFDYLVYPPGSLAWLVDVKGRRFPYVDEQGGSRRYWESWITREDLSGLADWESVFGQEYEARLVFAYLLQGPPTGGRPFSRIFSTANPTCSTPPAWPTTGRSVENDRTSGRRCQSRMGPFGGLSAPWKPCWPCRSQPFLIPTGQTIFRIRFR